MGWDLQAAPLHILKISFSCRKKIRRCKEFFSIKCLLCHGFIVKNVILAHQSMSPHEGPKISELGGNFLFNLEGRGNRIILNQIKKLIAFQLHFSLRL